MYGCSASRLKYDGRSTFTGITTQRTNGNIVQFTVAGKYNVDSNCIVTDVSTALELSTVPGFPAPGTGNVVRVMGPGQIEHLVTGLVVPTGITLGPDNALYVSNFGAAPP
jgi:sugar lactone lactonase YvrE